MKVLKTLGIALAVAPLFAVTLPTVLDAQTAQTAQTGTVVSPVIAEVQASAPAPAVAANAAVTSVAVPASTPSLSLATTANASNALLTGPSASAVALRMKHATTDAPAPLPRGGTDSKALMIVGLAAVVAGIVVGDDAGTILILGGAGIGLYGLYKYMQ